MIFLLNPIFVLENLLNAYPKIIAFILIAGGRWAKASTQTNLDFGGQRHFLKTSRADLQQNVGTFLAFLCSSNWNEWYASKRRSKGPGVEFKVCGMSDVNFYVN